MTVAQYYKIVGRDKNPMDDIICNSLIEGFNLHGINSSNEKAIFMSQMSVESMNFKKFEENMNYSAKRLLEIFPKYFNLSNVKSYANNPQKIANRVYANRYGNGDENSGDGWRFRGRSLIHLTFKNNYAKCAKELGVDILNNPDFAKEYEMAVEIAFWYWTDRKISSAILKNPKDVILEVTALINGGKNGLEDRRIAYNRIIPILSS